MNKALRLKMAKQQGEQLAEKYAPNKPTVDPFVIAKDKDILVQAKPDTHEGVSGMLLRHGNNFGIMYATYIESEGFQRFSVAHELAHYFLEGHIDHVFRDDDIHESRAGFISGDHYELEADQFAAGLLMPSHLIKPVLRKADPGLDCLRQLSEDFKTSLTATAIRYAELTEDAVAVVLSSGDTIDFCFLSDGMKTLEQLNWYKKGSPLPHDCGTRSFNSDIGRVRAADTDEREIDILDWLGGNKSVAGIEQVIGLGRYGKTLTVLSCPSIEDESYYEKDGDDDEELSESWAPRFRR